MVLVKVIKLIVNVNWPLNFGLDVVEIHCAIIFGLNVLVTHIVISFIKLVNLVAHYLEHNADG